MLGLRANGKRAEPDAQVASSDARFAETAHPRVPRPRHSIAKVEHLGRGAQSELQQGPRRRQRDVMAGPIDFYELALSSSISASVLNKRNSIRKRGSNSSVRADNMPPVDSSKLGRGGSSRRGSNTGYSRAV
jgi:hypothetical protein